MILSTSTFATIESYGSGESEGFLATIYVDQADVKSLLPDGLLVDTTFIDNQNKVPVTIYLGDMAKVHFNIGNRSIQTIKGPYKEITVTLPVVLEENPTKLLNYAARIRLTSFAGLISGRLLGLKKKMANIDFTESTFDVRTNDDEWLFTSVIKTIPDYNMTQFSKNLDFIKKNQRPIVTKISPFSFHCIDFIWNLKLTNSHPVEISMQFSEDFVGTFSGREFNSNSLDVTPFGAVAVSTDWRMGSPTRCN